jgi:1,4-dihydroxy-2-naphthoyl-CoA synthase
VAMALMKVAFSVGTDTLEEAVNTEVNTSGVLMHTDDFAEAAKAFLEKRKPNFTGK